MRALVYQHGIPRYLASRILYRRARRIWSVRCSPLRLRHVAVPATSRPNWVALQVLLSGICGSDLQMLTGQDSLYLAPEATYPFVPGHELVGRVEQTASGPCGGVSEHFESGERVAVWPVLGCASRGYNDCCPACQGGWDGLCQRRDRGWPGPAISIGFCRETGGGWSDRCLAHVSQLWRIPTQVRDSDAVLLDPAATSLACLLRPSGPAPDRTLVIGGGPVGLLTGYLHARLQQPGECEVLTRYPYQREWASRHGVRAAVVGNETDFGAWADQRSIRSVRERGYGMIYRGDYDRAIVTVASAEAFRWALGTVRPRGMVVLAATPDRFDGIDPTPLWYREVTVVGIMSYGPVLWEEQWRHPYRVLIPKLADGTLRFSDLVTHTFALEDYVQAFHEMVTRRQSAAVKIVFRPAEPSSEMRGE